MSVAERTKPRRSNVRASKNVINFEVNHMANHSAARPIQQPSARRVVDTPEAAFIYDPEVDPLSMDDVVNCGLVRSLAVVRLLLGDRNADLFRQPVDVALRYGTPEDSSLVALPLCPDNRRVLCAAPDYLARHGQPATVAQLAEHNCLLYQLGGRVHDQWRFSDGAATQTVLVRGDRFCDDADVVRRWAVAGVGIAYKSWLDVAADVKAGRLEVLLPGVRGEAAPLNLLCTHRAQLSKPVQLLRDELKARCRHLLEPLLAMTG